MVSPSSTAPPGVCVLQAPQGGSPGLLEFRGKQFAFKQVALPPASADVGPRLLGQVNRFARCLPVGLPRIHHFAVVGEVAWVIFERTQGGSLRDYISTGVLTDEDVIAVARDVGTALAALHEAGECHGSLSLENVVASDAGGWCLIDYGRSFSAQRGYQLRDIVDDLEPLQDLRSLGRILCAAALRQVADDRCELDEVRTRKPQLAHIIERLLEDDSGRQPNQADDMLVELGRAFPTLPAKPDTPDGPGVARPFVLRQLRKHLESRSGFGAVVLRGDAGAGKTHLVRAVKQDTGDTSALLATCRAWEVAPFAVVRQLLESFVLRDDGVDQQRLAELSEAAGPLARLLRPLSPLLKEGLPEGRVPDLETADDVYSQGLAEVLARILTQSPRTVVIEDVHWLDEGSRKVLKRVFDRLEAPLLLVVTTRAHVDDAHSAQRFLGSLEGAVVWDYTLAPLATEESSRVVSDYLGPLPISPEYAYALALLGDGTPLSVIEVVRAVLDEGLLKPEWGAWKLNVADVAGLRLPSKTSELISQRLKRLPADVVPVLRLAATMGAEFDVRAICAIHGRARTSATLLEARRLYLVESIGAASYRFIHQCVVDSLLGGVAPATLRRLHAEAVRALLDVFPGSLEEKETNKVFQLARHLSEAGAECDEALASRANLLAATRAAESYDNTAALRFLRHAHSTAAADSSRSTQIARHIAEVQLRLGNLQESLVGFEDSLEQERNPVERAQILSHIAVIHEARNDSERALWALGQALSELDEPVPRFTSRTAGALLAFLILPTDTRPHSKPQLVDKQRVEVLCTLFFQHNRLSMVASNAGGFVDGTLRCLEAARQLGPSQALSKAYTMAGLLQVTLGRKRAAQNVIRRALEITRETNDPPTTAHVLMNQSAVTGWLGDIDGALALGAEAIDFFHSWMIPSELAVLAMNLELMETVRGHGLRAWEWLGRAVPRAIQYEGSPIITELFAVRCRACATHLGLEERYSALLTRIDSACLRVPQNSDYHSLLYGARVRLDAERGELGDAFEATTQAFQQEGFEPRKVHMAVAEYYVAVAHARAHAWLRASVRTAAHVVALKRAAKELRAAARIPLLRAHSFAIDGYVALSAGKLRAAAAAFTKANTLAEKEAAPWVLYAVARGSAHLHRMRRNEGAALHAARRAEDVALHHGAVHRLRWIREEFKLTSDHSSALEIASADALGVPRAADEARHQLQTLVRLNRVLSGESPPDEQSRIILDETIRALGAERGSLYLRDVAASHGSVVTTHGELLRVAARDAGGKDLPDRDTVGEEILGVVVRSKEVVLFELSPPNLMPQPGIVAPLLVRGAVVGAVCLLADPARGPFTQSDGEVLRALCGQVPITLELARVLRDRDRLSEDLRQSQKMEAIGRLAGGIAHDFNNMLAAICVAVESVLAESPANSEHRPDLETIRRAADRATRLTRQLLAFSRRQVFDARPMDLNQTVRDIAPMLTRLLGERIEVEVDLESSLHLIKADAAQLEQVLVNLAVNARDAMPTGGRLRLRTRNMHLEAGQKPVLDAGDYVLLSVADTGEGMDAETRRRIFEPFFTTKTSESGTGLGLAIAYGVVRQSSGYIDLESAVGVGTEFRIYLPRTHEQVQTIPPVSTVRGGPRQGRILLVDDEPLVRHALGRTLRRMGYEVTNATGGREAIRILSHSPAVDLVITDVIMPEMNGVEMVEKLSAMGIRAKVLYISGYADGVLTKRADLGDRVEFMQKPLTNDELAAKIRDLLGQEEQSRPGGVS